MISVVQNPERRVHDMNKKEAFVLLVQTWVLAAGSRQDSSSLFKAGFATATLADAMQVPEEVIPEDIRAACEEYCMWQDGYPDVKRPSWLPERP